MGKCVACRQVFGMKAMSTHLQYCEKLVFGGKKGKVIDTFLILVKASA